MNKSAHFIGSGILVFFYMNGVTHCKLLAHGGLACAGGTGYEDVWRTSHLSSETYWLKYSITSMLGEVKRGGFG